jgi:uncharacterized membrane protein YdjX (TVP38/TMEM64 family)
MDWNWNWNWKRVGVRVGIRLLVIGLLILGQHYLGLDQHISTALDWVEQQPKAAALTLFLLGATLFSAISPTGYLPTILAGASFGIVWGIPVAYLSVNLAAALNMLILRRSSQCLRNTSCLKTRLEGMNALSEMVEQHKQPVLIVALLRLPYLGSGVLNYLISLSSVQAKHSVAGNALGFIPGAVLFTVLGGTARSLLRLVSAGEVDTAAVLILTLEITLVLVSIAGITYIVKKKKNKPQCTNALDQPPAHIGESSQA